MISVSSTSWKIKSYLLHGFHKHLSILINLFLDNNWFNTKNNNNNQNCKRELIIWNLKRHSDVLLRLLKTDYCCCSEGLQQSSFWLRNTGLKITFWILGPFAYPIQQTKLNKIPCSTVENNPTSITEILKLSIDLPDLRIWFESHIFRIEKDWFFDIQTSSNLSPPATPWQAQASKNPVRLSNSPFYTEKRVRVEASTVRCVDQVHAKWILVQVSWRTFSNRPRAPPSSTAWTSQNPSHHILSSETHKC